MIEGGGFGPHKFSRVEGGPSCFTEPRVSCRGSVGLDSFRQHDRGIFHQLSGRNSFLVPVSASLGPVGMVPYCLQRKIFLQAAHIPGEDNIVARWASCLRSESQLTIYMGALRVSDCSPVRGRVSLLIKSGK